MTVSHTPKIDSYHNTGCNDKSSKLRTNMMIKCKNCQTDFEPKTAKTQYCSTKCRVAGNRNKKEDSIVTELVETGIVTAVPERIVTLSNETPYEETVRLNKEATDTLNSLTLEEIKKKGIWLPNWRRTNGKS